MAHGGRRVGAGRKPGGGHSHRTPEMKALANAVVRNVLAADRNPVLRLVEIGYDPAVPVEVQVSACAAAAPYLFPRKSLDVTATVALDAPNANANANANAIVEKLLGRLARLPIGHLPTIEVDRPKEIVG